MNDLKGAPIRDLRQYCVENGVALPVYTTVPVDRVNGRDQWISEVNLAGHITKGRGTRKKTAEGIAAATCLARLRKEKEDEQTLVKELLQNKQLMDVSMEQIAESKRQAYRLMAELGQLKDNAVKRENQIKDREMRVLEREKRVLEREKRVQEWEKQMEMGLGE